MILSKDDILKATDLPTEEVDVPEWGGKVLVKGMDAGARDAYDLAIYKAKGIPPNRRAIIASLCIVDANGDTMFGESDIAFLAKKSYTALDRVVEVADKLSAIRPEDLEDAKKN